MQTLMSASDEPRPGLWLVSFFGQLVLVASIPIGVLAVESEVLGWSELGSPLGNNGFQFFNIAVSLSAGLLVGAAIGTAFPSARSSGRWVGPVQFAVLLWGVIHDSLMVTNSDVWSSYFFYSGRSQEMCCVVIYLITYPTLSGLGYSLGIGKQWGKWLQSGRGNRIAVDSRGG